MTRARKAPAAERYCLIAPQLHDNSRRWFPSEAAAVEAATSMVSHANRRGAEVMVVKAIARVAPKKPVVPVDVSKDFSQLELHL